MHHGTLLFNSNLDVLTESLKSDPLRYHDKAIKSVRSQVINLKKALGKEWTNQEFLLNIEASIREISSGVNAYKFTAKDLENIEKLRAEKYSTWVWNYGYGPTYNFKKRIQTGGIVFSVDLTVSKGIITEVKLNTNHSEAILIDNLTALITGSCHEKNAVLEKLTNLSQMIPSLPKPEELVKLFF